MRKHIKNDHANSEKSTTDSDHSDNEKMSVTSERKSVASFEDENQMNMNFTGFKRKTSFMSFDMCLPEP